MKDFQADRREFLKLMLSVSLVLSAGLEPEVLAAEVKKTALSPEDSLRRLLYLLGPWTEAERGKAEDFARRFLKHASGPYFSGTDSALSSVADRFSSQAMAIESISLRDLPSEERKLLSQLLGQLYTLVEVRFEVSHQPPWGECQTDRLIYTKSPT